MSKTQTCDVLIVGAGLVGSSLACALDALGLRVTLVEATAGGQSPAPSFDERNLALGRASMNALQNLGVWQQLDSAPEPIRRVHVSSRGDFGTVKLEAARYGLDAFGAVVVARELGAALERRLEQLSHLTRLRPARVVTLEAAHDSVAAMVEADGVETRRIQASLLVAADGSHSLLRAAAGIGIRHHDYQQHLFVATATCEKPHDGCAFERFTSDGPVALLPLLGHKVGTVLTVRSSEADTVAALSDDDYRQLLQSRFGFRLGRLGRIGRRSHYPLSLIKSDALFAGRTVLVGNAAQTLHPLGAQGFNLGLRDALTLAEVLADAQSQGRAPGTEQDLRHYARRRQPDRDETLQFSDGLAQLFGLTRTPIRIGRSLGMLALNLTPGLTDRLVSGAMGFRGDVPRQCLAVSR